MGSGCVTKADSSASWRRHIGPIASAVVALVWVGLAARRPAAHYHFAPLLVTVAWSYGRRWSLDRPLNRRETLTSLAGGATVAAGTGLALQITDRLEGVTFWHSGAVLTEVAMMIVLGALWGLWVARRPEPGALLTSADRHQRPVGAARRSDAPGGG